MKKSGYSTRPRIHVGARFLGCFLTSPSTVEVFTQPAAKADAHISPLPELLFVPPKPVGSRKHRDGALLLTEPSGTQIVIGSGPPTFVQIRGETRSDQNPTSPARSQLEFSDRSRAAIKMLLDSRAGPTYRSFTRSHQFSFSVQDHLSDQLHIHPNVPIGKTRLDDLLLGFS